MPAKTLPVEPEVSQFSPESDWKAFADLNLVPRQLKCDIIHGHPADEACKTRLPLEAASVVRHTQNGHGGGFEFYVRTFPNGSKKWSGWLDLDQAGYNIISLQCQVCDKYFDPRRSELQAHLRSHQGKFRGAYQNYRDRFFIVVRHKDAPDPNIRPSDNDDDDPIY